MNIWDLAKDKLRENEEKSTKLDETLEETTNADSQIKRRHESHGIVCGSIQCGKTTFLMKYLERTDSVKSTVALDYLYGRRTRGKTRDLCNIWELGAGTKLTNLLEVPLTAENLEIASVTLFLDLTKPSEMWLTFEGIMTAVNSLLDQLMQSLNKTDHVAYDRLLAAAKERTSGYGEDIKLCAPLPIPFLLVGAKYDEFQNMDSEARRNICQCLRFLAHYYGGSLMFYSSRMEALVRHGKVMFSHYLLETAISKSTNTDHNKPLLIPCGTDSLQNIGAPPLGEMSFARASQPVQLWKEAFCQLFPQKEATEVGDDPTKDPMFKETLIDRMVEQKEKDLELFIKQKKDRLAAEQKAMDKIASIS